LARYAGDSAKAIDLATTAIRLAPESAALRARCHNLIGLCRFFTFEDADLAIESWRSALEEARRASDDRLVRIVLHNLGLPYSYEGDFNESFKWFSELIAPGDKDAKATPFPQEAIAHLNIARIRLVQGRFDEAEWRLEQAMDRCRTFHLVGYGAQTLETYGNLHRERGAFRKALEFYDEAARAYGEAGQTDCELLDERAALFLRMGEIDRAQADANEYYRTRSPRLPSQRALALIALGRVQLYSGQLDQAEAALRDAVAVSLSSKLNYNAVRALTSLARLLWDSGRSQQAIDTLEEAVELSRRYDYSYWLASEAAQSQGLFTTATGLAADTWDHLRAAINLHAARTASGLGKPSQPASAIQGPSFDLTINLFGPVKVYRSAEEETSDDAWRLSKSLHILCYLASRRTHRASKDILADLFWPGDDWQSVAKNFHPTISHLRKALNHGQVVKKNFVVFKEGAYFFNPQYRYRIDTEEFEKLIVDSRESKSEGDIERAAAMAAKAVELYRGDFLEELYYDWVAELQGYYRDLNIEALNELARYHATRGEHEAAIRYGQMILQRDPYREDVHCLVMEAHVRAGNRAAAIEQFAELRRMLRGELGVEPLPATIAKYQSLIK
jgi:DNA-binding SARP family transcriptional activator/predicted negative regulator of RcsB-dependent stress response